MSSNSKPLILYGHWAAPNPFKVVTILKELGLPYEYHVVEFQDVKKPKYTTINPNGRLPTLIDPNTELTIWESGAIILYLIDQYDPNHKLSLPDPEGKYACIQWLMFQVSGQGPYFGQATWFARFHPEKIQSAIDRYINEIARVVDVLDKVLEDQEWLVGDKCTYADLSFVTWSFVARGLMIEVGKDQILQDHKNYSRWMRAMETRESVKEVVKIMADERAAHGLPP